MIAAALTRDGSVLIVPDSWSPARGTTKPAESRKCERVRRRNRMGTNLGARRFAVLEQVTRSVRVRNNRAPNDRGTTREGVSM